MEREVAVTTEIRSPGTHQPFSDDTTRIPANGDTAYTDLVAGDPLRATVQTEQGREQTYHWEETAAENGLSVGITADEIGFAVAEPP